MLDECLRLLELLFEVIPISSFVQETLQKSEFVVNFENLIWQTHEVTAELPIVLDLRTKMFTLVMLKLNHFRTHKQLLKMLSPNFVT